MDPIVIWIIILFSLTVILFVAEVFVPSGGVLAILATICLLATIVLAFMINRWFGVAVLVGTVMAAPFLAAMAIRLWQKTPIGKKMVLNHTVGELTSERVLVGTEGITLTEMRPMGECEFGQIRIEAKSETGRFIPAGRRVKVIEYHDTVATVREVDTTNPQAASDTRA